MSEVCALQVGDIESAADRMCLKVRQGKGGKDRYTLLSPRLLAALRAYWRDTRPQLWWFPNRAGTDPIEIQTAQRIDYAARNAAGIAPEGGIHGLRHAPARSRRRSLPHRPAPRPGSSVDDLARSASGTLKADRQPLAPGTARPTPLSHRQ